MCSSLSRSARLPALVSALCSTKKPALACLLLVPQLACSSACLRSARRRSPLSLASCSCLSLPARRLACTLLDEEARSRLPPARASACLRCLGAASALPERACCSCALLACLRSAPEEVRSRLPPARASACLCLRPPAALPRRLLLCLGISNKRMAILHQESDVSVVSSPYPSLLLHIQLPLLHWATVLPLNHQMKVASRGLRQSMDHITGVSATTRRKFAAVSHCIPCMPGTLYASLLVLN